MKPDTEHFKVKELDCKDGTAYPETWYSSRLKPLMDALEAIRGKISEPLFIHSGYRTEAHNAKVNGANKSMHKEGLAVDIAAIHTKPHKLVLIIESLIKIKAIPDGGIGLYKGFVHYDIRTIIGKPPTRWAR